MAGFQVFNRSTGDQFVCPQGESVLKAMELMGVRCVPVGCRGGGCGLCKIRVLAGRYECGKMSKVHAPPEAVQQGEVLACRIYPVSDLTIECVPLPEAALAKQTTTKALR